MTVLTPDEIKLIKAVSADIVKDNQGNASKTVTTVGQIKAKYQISEAEYQMCMDLSMATIRWKNEARYYKKKFDRLVMWIGKMVEDMQTGQKGEIIDDE